ncbi:TetR/AcrR family transcriptional regulator [Streptosporangium sp. G11]|uniref:TetR/AcrR family transcriptional regulator n=1 Tax=Streptosporangium sp. G11 TaxID=3436926 RepID=UPI003EC0B661
MSQSVNEGSSGIGRRRALARREQNASWVERRNAVLTAASDALRARGYQALSMSDIAQRLGSDRASVYYYFASKQEIFLGLVEQAVQANVELIEKVAASDEPATARLRAVIESLAESYERHYPYLHLYVQEDMRRLSESESPDERHLLELARRYDEAVLRIARDGVESGEFRRDADPHMIKFAVLGAVNWTHRWFVPGGRLSGAEVGRELADIFLRGVLAAPGA